jgi:thioredoxin-dependent peroxiredoxin
VLGISTDSIESHKRFAQKLSLPYPLLADVDAQMCKDYGVDKKTTLGDLRSRRVSFLLDGEGVIEKIWDPVSAQIHNEQVLDYLGSSIRTPSSRVSRSRGSDIHRGIKGSQG